MYPDQNPAAVGLSRRRADDGELDRAAVQAPGLRMCCLWWRNARSSLALPSQSCPSEPGRTPLPSSVSWAVVRAGIGCSPGHEIGIKPGVMPDTANATAKINTNATKRV